MKYAIRHRCIDHNSVVDAERPRDQGEGEASVFRVLNSDEINAFLTKVRAEKYYTLFMLAVMSGARRGELFGLKWSDILWETSQIHVKRSFNGGEWYKPKTKHSNRKVDVGPSVMVQLRKWRKACPPNKLMLVFPNETGQPIGHSHMLRHHFGLALDRAELPKIRFHDLRHT